MSGGGGGDDVLNSKRLNERRLALLGDTRAHLNLPLSTTEEKWQREERQKQKDHFCWVIGLLFYTEHRNADTTTTESDWRRK